LKQFSLHVFISEIPQPFLFMFLKIWTLFWYMFLRFCRLFVMFCDVFYTVLWYFWPSIYIDVASSVFWTFITWPSNFSSFFVLFSYDFQHCKSSNKYSSTSNSISQIKCVLISVKLSLVLRLFTISVWFFSGSRLIR